MPILRSRAGDKRRQMHISQSTSYRLPVRVRIEVSCWNISSVFIVITLGVIAILCVLTLLGVFVCIFDHDDKNDKSSKE